MSHIASANSNRHFVRNTVDVANQLLDAIEQDLSASKAAVSHRDALKLGAERELAHLQAQLLQARGEINRLNKVVEDQQRGHAAEEYRREEELQEYKQSCQSEMDRVLHQVRVKEEQMMRAVDHSSSFRQRSAEMEAQLGQLLRERAEMSEEFVRLHEEKKDLADRLMTSERYSSTLELACAEMKARLESMQAQLTATPNVAHTADNVAYEREKEREKQKYIAKHFHPQREQEQSTYNVDLRTSAPSDKHRYQRYQDNVNAHVQELTVPSRQKADRNAELLTASCGGGRSEANLWGENQPLQHNSHHIEPQSLSRSRPPPRPPQGASSFM